MKHKRTLLKISGATAAAALIITPVIVCALNANGKKVSAPKADAATNDQTYSYRPIPIAYESFTGPLIMGSYNKDDTDAVTGPYKVQSIDQGSIVSGSEILDYKVADGGGSSSRLYNKSTNTIDSSCGWWINSAYPSTEDKSTYITNETYSSKKNPMTVGADGNITFESGVSSTSGLTWKMPYSTTSGKENNGIKLDKNNNSRTIYLDEYNSYANIYVLATAANAPGSATINLTIKYSDESTKSASFSITDWCSPTETAGVTEIAVRSFSRVQNDKNKLNFASTSNYPCLYQCTVKDLDKSKLVQSIKVDFSAPTSSQNMVVTIYGIAGAYSTSVAKPSPEATNIKNKSARIEWTKVENAAKYRLDVYYKQPTTDGNGETEVAVLNNQEISSDAVYYDLSNLDPGQTYYYRMRAENSSQEPTDSSTVKSFTTNDNMTVLDPSDITTSSFKANWTPLSGTEQAGIKQYTLQVSDSTAFASGSTDEYAIVELDSKTLLINKFNNTTIPEGKTLYYRIRYEYEDSSTPPDWSDVKSVETLVAASSVELTPNEISINVGSQSTVTSKVWGADSKLATNQNISWSGANDYVSITTDATDKSKHTITALKPGSVTLTATSQDGSKTATCTVNIGIDAPVLSTPESTYHSFTAKWGSPKWTASTLYTYTLEYATKADWSDAKEVANITSDSTAKLVDNLVANTTYYMRLKVVYTPTTGTPVESAWSNTQSVTLPVNPAYSISVPSTLSVDVGAATATSLSTVINGADSQMATDQSVTIEADSSGYLEIKTLSAGSHTIKAKKAISGNKVTLTIKAVSTPTITATCVVTINFGKPTITNVTDLKSTSYKLTWNKVQGADSYTIGYGVGGKFTEITELPQALTSYTITGLSPTTKYTCYVMAYSGEIATVDYKEVTTEAEDANSITLDKVGPISMLVGDSIGINTTVKGAVTTATNQLVTSAKYSGTADVVTSTSTTPGTSHTITAKTVGDAVIRFTSAEKSTVTTDLNVTVVSAKTKDASKVSYYSFTANWEDIKAPDYYLDVATDENFNNILPNYNNKNVKTTSLEITGLNPLTQYYYRVRYANNGVTSANSNVTTLKTTSDVTGLTLSTYNLKIKLNKLNQVTATVKTYDVSGKQVNWSIDDTTIAVIDNTTNDNQSTVKIKGLKAGSTVIRAKVQGYDSITEQVCTITVENDPLVKPVVNSKDVTKEGFTITWNKADFDPDVKFLVNVWYINKQTQQKETILLDKQSTESQIRLTVQDYPDLKPGIQYQYTVSAVRNSDVATSDIKSIKMPGIANPIAVIIGSVIGGLIILILLLIPALYYLWKYNKIRTINSMDAEKLIAEGKNSRVDKAFRKLDKFWVKVNRKIFKPKKRLLTNYGTKEEFIIRRTSKGKKR